MYKGFEDSNTNKDCIASMLVWCYDNRPSSNNDQQVQTRVVSL